MPETTAQYEQSMKLPAVCTLLPIRDMLDDVMVRIDGCYVAGYRIRGALTYFASEEDRNELKARVDALIRTCPEESMRIQVRYEVNDQIGEALDEYVDARRSPNDAALKMDEERVTGWHKRARGGEFLTRNLAIYFIWNAEVHKRVLAKSGQVWTGPGSTSKQSFSLSKNACVTKAKVEHEGLLAQFGSILRGIESSMVAAELGATRMTHEEMAIALQVTLSPFSPFRIKPTADPLWLRYRSVREQIANCLIDSNDSYMAIDRVLWGVVTLKSPPEQTWPGIIRELQTLGFPLVISTNITIPNQTKVLDTYKSRHKKMVGAQTDHRGQFRMDMAAQVAAAELAEIQARIMASSTKAVTVSLTVAFRTSFAYVTAQQLELAEQQLADRREHVMHVISRMDGAVALPEAKPQRRIFLGTLPGLATKDQRDIELLSAHAADMVPIEMPFDGTPKAPMMLFATPYRQLLPFSPFDPGMENANGLIVASSGSGKSMLVQRMILSAARMNVMVSILERGDSYANTVRYMGGQMITMSLDSPHAINPFDLGPGETALTNDHRSFLVNLIRHMIGNSNSDADILSSVLENTVAEAYRVASYRSSSKTPTLSDVHDGLENYIDKDNAEVVVQEARMAAVKLRPWVGEGTYAKLLDRQTTVDMHTPWLYFNVEKLKDDPRLETAMSLLIAYATTKRAEGTSGQKCVTILDECWSLLQIPCLASTVEQLFRTARKRGACVWGISQAVEDFTGTMEAPNRTGSAILATTAFRLIGRQKGNTEILRHYLHLSEAAIEYIKSMGMTEKGKQSQFLLCLAESSHSTHSLLIQLTPTEYWVATSFPRERSYRTWWLQEHKGMDFAEAIQALAAKFPEGLSRLSDLPEERSGDVAAARYEVFPPVLAQSASMPYASTMVS